MTSARTAAAVLPRRAIALVLAGGRGSRLHELTDSRCKPAVYFGGKFRIIDFALSNCMNSGLRRIGVLTQYVRRVGGLADTVVDADEAALAQARATGFVFDAASGAALAQAVRRARGLYADPPCWTATMQRAMRQDFSWDEAARAYRRLYQGLLSHDTG